MDNEYGLLSEDEVLYVRSGRILMSNPTFKVSEFLDSLAQLVSEQEREWSDEREGWFTHQGQSCEVLRFDGQGWQRGRVRIRLEFCPESSPKLLRESRSTQDSGYRPDDLRDEEFGQDEFEQDEFERDKFRQEDYGREMPSPRRSRDYPQTRDEFLPRQVNPDLSVRDNDY